MPRRDPKPGAVVLGVDRGGTEQGPLLVQAAQDAVGDLDDLLAAEDADHLVDVRNLLKQLVLLPLGQAAGDDHPLDAAVALAVEHLPDDPARFLPGGVDEPAGVDDHQVGRLPLGHQRVAVLGQQPEHPLGIDEVLGAAEADERDRPSDFGIFGRAF